MAKLFKSSTLFSFLCMIVLASMGKIPWAHALSPSSLVPSQTLLQYHHGPLLTGPKSINIYLIWYGPFSVSHKLAVSDFFASFGSSSSSPSPSPNRPTVSSWWTTARAYKDASGRPVSGAVRLAGQVSDIRCSLGTNLKRAHIATLVRNAILKGVFAFDPNGVYLLLTAANVAVERFCVGSCGYHETVAVSPTRRVVVAHVGDSSTQCPGLCAWPFAVPMYGPPGPALIAPNGVGADGMIMNVAAVLAGSTTNPFGKGYFQGDELAPLEAVTACAGIFGSGAYPGYAGKVLVEGRSKASYNVYGARNRLFLLPAMWDPVSLACKSVV